MTTLHIQNRVAYITLDRAEKRNALSPELIGSIKAQLHSAETNADVKVIVLRANGEVFSAGADLAYLQKLQNFSYEENLADSLSLKDLFQQIYTSTKVVIAQVQGHAIAGGCGLAAVCDFVYAVPEAQFGYTEVKIGFIPAIVSYFLLRKIGEGRAKELLLTGKLIDATTAKNYGLINEIVPADALENAVTSLAEQLCNTTSGQSLTTTKALCNVMPTLTLEAAMQYAAEQNATARASNDCKKGINAFVNKEKIVW